MKSQTKQSAIFYIPKSRPTHYRTFAATAKILIHFVGCMAFLNKVRDFLGLGHNFLHLGITMSRGGFTSTRGFTLQETITLRGFDLALKTELK